MRPIKVSITLAHIRDGVRSSACNCPIALALKDTLITDNVAVANNVIKVNGTVFDLDKKDKNFMDRFDNGLRVRPYSFNLCRTSRK